MGLDFDGMPPRHGGSAWQTVSALRLHRIQTPENVDIHALPASLGSRLVARLLDLVLISVIDTVGLTLIGALAGDAANFAEASVILFVFVVPFLYSIGFEWRWRGQTPGKRAVGLRVVTMNGSTPDLLACVLRNLLRPIDALPALGAVGALASMFGAPPRRLGDRLAGTYVLHEGHALRPEAIARRLPMRERSALSIAAQARRRLSPAEREFLLDLCLRRDELEPSARRGLFAEVAEHFRARFAVDRDAHQSDERWVLLLAAAALDDGAAGAPGGAVGGRPSAARR